MFYTQLRSMKIFHCLFFLFNMADLMMIFVMRVEIKLIIFQIKQKILRSLLLKINALVICVLYFIIYDMLSRITL